MRSTAPLILLCLLLPPIAAAQDDDPRLVEIESYVLADTPDWADRDAIREALTDAGGNWEELAGALSAVYPGASQPYDQQDYLNMVWLLQHATHLDRLELTSEILVENMDEALSIAGRDGWDKAGELFRRYVLNYRLDDEPVTRWRRELRLRYAGGERELGALVARITAGFIERERGYYGNLADPLSVDNARAGTGRELAILTAAALRAQGYPTRFVRENLSGESWVEVYDGGPGDYDPAAWLPVYPGAPERTGEAGHAADLCGGRIALVTAGDAFGREQVTGRYSDICAVRPRFSEGGEPQPDFEHYSITAWHEGTFVPLDDLGYPLGELDYPPDATEAEGDVYYVGAPGDYRLQCGVRYPGAVVHVQTRDFEAAAGGDVLIEVALDAPADLPQAALIERTVDWRWEREEGMPPLLLMVIYDDGEPSVRARALLAPFADDERVLFEEDPYTSDCADLTDWIREDLKVTDEDEKPAVILLDGAGRTLLYLRGYDLNIADWVERAVAGYAAGDV